MLPPGGGAHPVRMKRRQVVRSPRERIKLEFPLTPFNLTCQCVDRVRDGRWEEGMVVLVLRVLLLMITVAARALAAVVVPMGRLRMDSYQAVLFLLTFVTSSITLQTLSVDTGGTRTATPPRRRSNRQQR